MRRLLPALLLPILVLVAACDGAVTCDPIDDAGPVDAHPGIDDAGPIDAGADGSEPCTSFKTCDDGNPCTFDICFDGFCLHSDMLLTPCGDGGVCYEAACCEGVLSNSVFSPLCLPACGPGQVLIADGHVCIDQP